MPRRAAAGAFFPFSFGGQAVAGMPIYIRRHLAGLVDLRPGSIGVVRGHSSFHFRACIAPFDHVEPVNGLHRMIWTFTRAVVIEGIALRGAPSFDLVPK